MKKTMNAKKMTKRALALMLTMSMILGMTFTVFAQEEGEGGTTAPETTTSETPTSEPSTSESQTSEPSAAVQEIAAVQDTADAAFDGAQVTVDTIQAQDGSGLIDTAEGAVFAILPENGEIRDAIIGNLVDAENGVIDTNAHLENAKGMVDEVNEKILDPLAEAKKLAKEAKTELETEYVEKDSETTGSAQDAIDNAKIANTSNSRTDAYAARDKAVSDLGDAEAERLETIAAYNDANAKIEKAQKIYDDIKADQKNLEAKLGKMQQELKDAKTSSAAALEAMKGIQKNLWDLDQEAAKIAEELIELQGISDQYFAMMVEYYNKGLGEKNVVYDDGNLDIQENANKITDKQIDQMAKNPGNFTMELGRNLLKQLVTYMFKNDVRVNGEYIDPDSIEFGIEGSKVTATEGIVVDTNKGQKVEAGTKEQFKKTNSNQSDEGRTNRFTVKYKNKAGEEIVKYYNYVFKSSDEAKVNGLENGIIYLALIEQEQNEDGTTKWVANQVESDNNYDNYRKLQNRLAALQAQIEGNPDLREKVAQYEQAKRAVDAATAKVKELDDQVQKLQNKKNIGSELRSLRTKELEAAKKALAIATEQMEKMEAKVEEARRAVTGINLDRFNVVPTDDTDDSTGTTTPAITSITPGVIITPVFPAGADATTVAATGVAGAAVGTPAAGAGLVADAGAGAGGAVAPAAEAPVIMEDDLLPGAAEASTLTDLADEELPAAGAEETMSLWWLWLLLLLLLLIIAYCIYKYNKDKENEAA